jgi:hypothetical protein
MIFEVHFHFYMTCHYTNRLLVLLRFDTAGAVDTLRKRRQQATHFSSVETVGYSLHECWDSRILTSRIPGQQAAHFTSTETAGCSLHECWDSRLLTSRVLRQCATHFTRVETVCYSLHEYWNSGLTTSLPDLSVQLPSVTWMWDQGKFPKYRVPSARDSLQNNIGKIQFNFL